VPSEQRTPESQADGAGQALASATHRPLGQSTGTTAGHPGAQFAALASHFPDAHWKGNVDGHLPLVGHFKAQDPSAQSVVPPLQLKPDGQTSEPVWPELAAYFRQLPSRHRTGEVIGQPLVVVHKSRELEQRPVLGQVTLGAAHEVEAHFAGLSTHTPLEQRIGCRFGQPRSLKHSVVVFKTHAPEKAHLFGVAIGHPFVDCPLLIAQFESLGRPLPVEQIPLAHCF